MNSGLTRKILWSLGLALLVYIGLALYSDWNELTAALSGFPYRSLAPVFGLALVNYVGRWLRWHWFLRLVGSNITRYDSARIFGVGMMMVMTPGKAGEFLKSYMIRSVAGTPMSATAPTILAERLFDGTAMLLLAAAGLIAFPNTPARIMAVVGFATFLLVVVAVQYRPLALRLLAIGGQLPVVNRFAHHLESFYESTYILFGPRRLALSIIVGALLWAAEGIAYAIVLAGFGVQPTPQVIALAIFIFCISTVIGAFLALPGGLGGVEGSLVALSVQLFALPASTATAAALLIRFCTLWFGVAIGVVSFILWPRLLSGAEGVPATAEPQPTVQSEA